jgi:Ca2+-binding EF-hand superfamily protein
MAFDVLDKDGSGQIDLQDIAAAYDVSMHPEYISGKRTKEDILREFLDGFDVGGVKDGVVTRAEFQNYYSTISCSIARDDYFELMIRNAWHISGGEGAAANSANRRVLVTRADGSQYVQEIQNDLGLSAKDKKGMAARLQAQGIQAASIDLYGAGGDAAKGAAPAPTPPPPALGARPSTAGGNAKSRHKKKGGASAAAVAAAAAQAARAEPSPGLKLVIGKIKAEMKARGSGGFAGLQRRFRIMDDDNSKSLSMAEFKKALKEFKMDLSEADLRQLFEYFDSDGGGSIDFEEFVQGVRDPLSARRQKLVDLAFSVIDKDGSGMVDAAEVAGMYDASKHPEVIARRKTPTQVLTEFLDNFDVGGVKDGIVTRQEFSNYYTNLGASIDNDDYFELMIRNAWHLSGGEGNFANTANMRVVVTDSAGNQRTVEVKNDLGLRKDDPQGIYQRLAAQGERDIQSVNGRPIKVTVSPSGQQTVSVGEGNVAQLNTNNFKKPVVRAAPAARGGNNNSSAVPGANDAVLYGQSQPARVPGAMANTMGSLANSAGNQRNVPKNGLSSRVMNQMQVQQQQRLQEEEKAIVGSTLLDVLRVQVLSRGASGIIDLQRRFVEMDADGSKALDYAEFKQALLSLKLAFSEEQLQALFTYFGVFYLLQYCFYYLFTAHVAYFFPPPMVLIHTDTDNSGAIDFEELLYGLRVRHGLYSVLSVSFSAAFLVTAVWDVFLFSSRGA